MAYILSLSRRCVKTFFFWFALPPFVVGHISSQQNPFWYSFLCTRGLLFIAWRGDELWLRRVWWVKSGSVRYGQSPGTLIVDQPANQPTDRLVAEELKYSHDRARRHQRPTNNLLEVWQNPAIFGGRPIGAAIEALLTIIKNWRSSVLPIDFVFIAAAVSVAQQHRREKTVKPINPPLQKSWHTYYPTCPGVWILPGPTLFFLVCAPTLCCWSYCITVESILLFIPLYQRIAFHSLAGGWIMVA